MLELRAKPVTEALARSIKSRVDRFKSKVGRPPKLSVVLVGDDPASVIYTTRKGKAALAVGMEHESITFPANASPADVRKKVQSLDQNPTVDGILIQRPLPAAFVEQEVIHWISPLKDVDGFHPENVGNLNLGLPALQPCTPTGVIALLKHYGIETTGKISCVVGRSALVGRPMGALLLRENSTVIHCHSKTRDLPSMTRQADILVVAAGIPHFVDESFVKPGATVIDVGIHRLPDGSICGDVVYESVAKKASALTPVPGGVGPMTISLLLENTILGAELRAGIH